MASPVSVRFSRITEAKVRQIAAIERRSLADTVKVLTEEAVRQREFPDILFANGPTGRRAVLRNGPDIWEILEPYIIAAKNWDLLRASYPQLEEAQLRTAVRYYESYPEEIDARIALNQEG